MPVGQGLTDRRSECRVLDRLLSAVLAGESRALVVHGEAGVGKTVLLDYLAERAAGWQVVRVVGVQSEMELAFAGLHRLCVPDAASLTAEAAAVCEATGSRLAPFAAMMLASFRGREAEAAPLIQSALEEGAAAGQGVAVTYALWVAAILYNGLGRYADALASARQASEHHHPYVSGWALPELITAAVQAGDTHTAGDALDLLAERTRAGGTEEGLGIQARCRALLSDGKAAEGYYREAIGRLEHTRLRPELARTHLLYGEWLRRERRRGEAREHLRTAYQMLDEMGMAAFAGRARRELLATEETTGQRAVRAAHGGTALTSQEAQVARLAREGLSNPEIAARLFISTRTVQYHLSKVFTELGISSRGQLHQALPGDQL